MNYYDSRSQYHIFGITTVLNGYIYIVRGTPKKQQVLDIYDPDCDKWIKIKSVNRLFRTLVGSSRFVYAIGIEGIERIDPYEGCCAEVCRLNGHGSTINELTNCTNVVPDGIN